MLYGFTTHMKLCPIPILIDVSECMQCAIGTGTTETSVGTLVGLHMVTAFHSLCTICQSSIHKQQLHMLDAR